MLHRSANFSQKCYCSLSPFLGFWFESMRAELVENLIHTGGCTQNHPFPGAREALFGARLVPDLWELPLGGWISQEAIQTLRQMGSCWSAHQSARPFWIFEWRRKVQRDFPECMISDFFSKNACHFATFQWKNSHWLCLKMQNKMKIQGNFTWKY